MSDGYSYPSEAQLARLTAWNGDWRGCFAYARSIWWAPDWGWREETEPTADGLLTRYFISTGGWSGNEDIMAALEANTWLWMFFWVESRRGGHYIFEVPQPLESWMAT